MFAFSFFSASLGMKLAEAEPGASEELLGYLEAAVMEQVEQKGLSRWDGSLVYASASCDGYSLDCTASLSI